MVVSFLHFTLSGKILNQGRLEELSMHIAITSATTAKKPI